MHIYKNTCMHMYTHVCINVCVCAYPHVSMFAVLWNEPRALHMRGKLSATAIDSTSLSILFDHLTTCVKTGRTGSFLIFKTISRADGHLLPRFKRSWQALATERLVICPFPLCRTHVPSAGWPVRLFTREAQGAPSSTGPSFLAVSDS